MTTKIEAGIKEPEAILPHPSASADNRRLYDYMRARAWSMEPQSLREMASRQAMTVIMEKASQPPIAVKDGIATVPIHGVLSRESDALLSLFGVEQASCQALNATLSALAADDAVDAIMLHIESPGGEVSGIEELGDVIAGIEKPVHAFVEAYCASGAYWLASQADRISTSPNSQVGSIGVYSVEVDASKMAENQGVKIHVVKSGEHKGAGVLGTEVTEEHLAASQDIVDAMAQRFIDAVARGRGSSPDGIAAIADGRMWISEKAKQLGLVDRTATTYEMALAELAAIVETKQMADTEKAALEKQQLEQARTEALAEERKRVADILAAFPNDEKFGLEQANAGSTLVEAKVAYVTVLEKRLAEKAKIKPPAPAGAEAVPGDEEGDETEMDFMATARALAEEKNIPLREAMSRTARKNPELYTAHKDAE